MEHSLVLGSLSLDERAPVAEGYSFAVLADGMSFGVAQGVREVVTSLLADSDNVRITRYGNREVTFAVEIEGPDLAAVSLGEAVLRREVGRANTLMWTAPDVLSVPTVFEVVTSEMRQVFNDLDELRRKRTFELTLTCAAGARSVGLTTVTVAPPPLPVAPTVVLNNADTTTNWSAYLTTYSRAHGFVESPVLITDAGDGVYVSTFGTNLRFEWNAMSPVILSGTPYLTVEMLGTPPASLQVKVGGTWDRPPVAMTKTTTVGTVQYVLNVGDVTVQGVRALWASADPFGGQQANAVIYDVSASSALPSVTARQMSRVIEVGGTERTPCSLRLNPAAGEAMGAVVLHTSREELTGYSPALRQYRFSGNTVTADSTLMSGAREPLNLTPVVATIPIKSLPEDGYVLMARIRSDAVGTYPLVWQARTLVGATYLGGYEGVANATFSVANKWTLIPLGLATLPPVRASVESWVQVNLNRLSMGGATLDLDEWWVFRAGEDSALTIVDDDTTSFLWLDSPDLKSAVPRVWVGGNGDRSDAHHPGLGLISQGNHVLHPEGTAVFVASSGIQNPTVTATYNMRWHSNAAE